MNEDIYKQFVDFIKERHDIWWKKEMMCLPPPWTEDVILQRYKFTNIWRQDDKTTKMLQMRLQELFDEHEIKVNIFYLRLINRMDQIQLLPLLRRENNWDLQVENLIYSDAFIILPNLLKGTLKIDEIKKLVQVVAKRADEGWTDVKKIYQMPRITGLVLYEMMCDWWQWKKIPEEYCNIGGGALGTLELLYPQQKIQSAMIIELMERIKKEEKIVHPEWGKLTMRCIEGMCCEFRKYLNLKNNPKARKRFYVWNEKI